jgi:hypothetical protein
MTPGSTTVKRNIQFWCWAFPFVIDWRWFTSVAEVVQGRRRNRGQLEAKNACPQRKICKRKMERPRPIAPRNKIATKSPRLAAKRGVFRGAHRHSTQPSQEREREQWQSMAEDTWHGGEHGRILKESERGARMGSRQPTLSTKRARAEEEAS